MKLAEAIRKVAEIERRIALGLDPRQSMRPLSDWFDGEYLPSIRATNRSWRSDQSRFDTHIRPVLGARSVSEMTPRDLVQLIAGLRPAPGRDHGRERLADSTINRVVALLKVLFGRLAEDGLIDANPAVTLKLRRERNQRGRVLSGPEMVPFLKALAVAPPKVNLLIRLMLLTGVRLGEALSARWSQLDLQRRHLRLPDTKSGRPRVVPLSDEALEVVGELRAIRENGSDFVFPGRSRCGHMGRPSRHFRALIEAAGTQGLWIHDLRRTFATLAAEQVPIHEVSRFLGHSTVGVTERYVVTHDERLHATAAVVGQRLAPVLASAGIAGLDTDKEV